MLGVVASGGKIQFAATAELMLSFCDKLLYHHGELMWRMTCSRRLYTIVPKNAFFFFKFSFKICWIVKNVYMPEPG